MTEPQSGEPTEPLAAAEPAPAAPAPAAPAPPAPPVAPAAPYPYAGYDPTFAPIPRAPRTPWIAPQRKAAAIAISIGAAVILLVVGALIGAGIAHHHDHDTRFERAGYNAPADHQPFRNGGAPAQQRPNIPRAPAPTSTSTR